jgi:hypothetical protein
MAGRNRPAAAGGSEEAKPGGGGEFLRSAASGGRSKQWSPRFWAEWAADGPKISLVIMLAQICLCLIIAARMVNG